MNTQKTKTSQKQNQRQRNGNQGEKKRREISNPFQSLGNHEQEHPETRLTR